MIIIFARMARMLMRRGLNVKFAKNHAWSTRALPPTQTRVQSEKSYPRHWAKSTWPLPGQDRATISLSIGRRYAVDPTPFRGWDLARTDCVRLQTGVTQSR